MIIHWQTKNFEDCMDKVTYTNKIQRKDFLKSGDFPIISQEAEYINGYWNNINDLFKVNNPVIIFGDHTQVLKYIDFDFVLGADGVKILNPKSFLGTKYLYYFLQSVDLKSLGYARHYRLLKEIEIHFPTLSEQHRIVKILDKVFANISKVKENTENNLQNAKELFESYLQSVFANPGKDWEEKKIKEIGLTQTGFTPKSTNKDYYGDFIPFIKPADVNFLGDGTIRYNNEGLSEVGLEMGRKIDKNSILMVCIGATIGKIGFATKEVSCNQQINTLTPESKYEAKLFYYILRTKSFFNKIMKGSSQATLPIINKSKWENLSVAFPKLSIEQKSIVAKLDTLSTETKRLEGIYKQKLADLEELKKSVLKKAFSGEL